MSLLSLIRFGVIVLSIFITPVAVADIQKTSGEDNFDPSSPPGRFVSVGLHMMYIDCMGDSAPTVLIDVGLADASANWYKLAKQLSNNVKVCLYDRAGYGLSDTGPGARTTSQITKELHALLDKAEVPGPYILVGHSFGGFTARYFATSYPEETAGLVLVESSHPDQIYRLAGLDKINKKPLKVARREPPPDHMNAFEKRWYFLNSSRKATFAQMEELRYFKDSAFEVKHAGPLPDVPLAVLTRGKHQLPEVDGVSLEQEWQDMQSELLTLSRNSWQQIIKDAGHNLYADAPDIVISTILKVVEQVRAKRISKLIVH